METLQITNEEVKDEEKNTEELKEEEKTSETNTDLTIEEAKNQLVKMKEDIEKLTKLYEETRTKLVESKQELNNIILGQGFERKEVERMTPEEFGIEYLKRMKGIKENG